MRTRKDSEKKQPTGARLRALDDPAVLQHHGHLPAAVLVVLAEQGLAERPAGCVFERGYGRVAHDAAARKPQPQVELVVLVPHQRLVKTGPPGGSVRADPPYGTVSTSPASVALARPADAPEGATHPARYRPLARRPSFGDDHSADVLGAGLQGGSRSGGHSRAGTGCGNDRTTDLRWPPDAGVQARATPSAPGFKLRERVAPVRSRGGTRHSSEQSLEPPSATITSSSPVKSCPARSATSPVDMRHLVEQRRHDEMRLIACVAPSAPLLTGGCSSATARLRRKPVARRAVARNGLLRSSHRGWCHR